MSNTPERRLVKYQELYEVKSDHLERCRRAGNIYTQLKELLQLCAPELEAARECLESGNPSEANRCLTRVKKLLRDEWLVIFRQPQTP